MATAPTEENPFPWMNAVQAVAGIGSSFMGQREAKRASQAQERYDQQRLAAIMGAARMDPNESADLQQARMRSQQMLAGEDPAMRLARERAMQVQRAQSGMAEQRALDVLRTDLARRGMQGSTAGQALLARQAQEQAQAAGLAELQREYMAQQLAQQERNQGLAALMDVQGRQAQNRQMLVSALSGAMPTQSQSAAFRAQSAAGYGQLGSQLFGRGLEGLSAYYRPQPQQTPYQQAIESWLLRNMNQPAAATPSTATPAGNP